MNKYDKHQYKVKFTHQKDDGYYTTDEKTFFSKSAVHKTAEKEFLKSDEAKAYNNLQVQSVTWVEGY